MMSPFASLADIIHDTPKGEFPHPNTMTCKLMAGDKAILELEYYSPAVGVALAATVALSWMIGCPLLGFVSD
jgi:hypothetical protein